MISILQSVSGRTLLAVAAAAALLSIPLSAQAQWPSKPIRLIVPFAPGGSNDNIARVLSVKLGARIGQTIVVDNRGGAGGTIGTDLVAKSSPDGYTLLFASTSITTNAASGKKLPYDLVKDLVPIGGIASSPFAVVVSNQTKATTLREYIDLARASPKSISYGSAGVGGINHLGTELLAAAAKVELVHVPYKGIGPAFTDLIGGDLQMLLPSLASVIEHIRSGRMRALAVTGVERSALAPEIPTAAEAGLPGFQLEVWFGLLAPANLPEVIIKQLNQALNAVLALPEIEEVLARDAATPKAGTPEDFGRLIQSDLTRWARLIKDTGIQVE